jgi:hypothetical protein
MLILRQVYVKLDFTFLYFDCSRTERVVESCIYLIYAVHIRLLYSPHTVRLLVAWPTYVHCFFSSLWTPFFTK